MLCAAVLWLPLMMINVCSFPIKCTVTYLEKLGEVLGINAMCSKHNVLLYIALSPTHSLRHELSHGKSALKSLLQSYSKKAYEEGGCRGWLYSFTPLKTVVFHFKFFKMPIFHFIALFIVPMVLSILHPTKYAFYTFYIHLWFYFTFYSHFLAFFHFTAPEMCCERNQSES